MDERGRVVPLGAGAAHWLAMGWSDARKRQNRDTYQHLVADVLGLDRAAVGRPVLVPAEKDRAAAQQLRDALPCRGRLVGLNTGAGGRWERKQWTLPHQIEFARRSASAGLGVLLLGGPAERQRHAELLAATPGLPVFDGGTDHSVREFAALVELCDALVTGDTFALHVATARGVPVVALFGPTSSHEVELYGRGEKIVPPDLDCLCCYLPTCEVAPHCQERIAPAAVLAAVQRCLDGAPGGSSAAAPATS
jgi:heptosyltransferase-2